MAIKLKTHKMLWGRAGNRCSFPNCRISLVEDATETDDPSIIGEEAHIVAREKEGPRGDSDLPLEKRDKYDNLILLCNIHHKIVDDQVKTYSIEKLQQFKKEHIEWVNANLNADITKQKDDEIYATYIDEWVRQGDINGWNDWSSYIFSGGQPSMYKNHHKNLDELNTYILSRIWPKRYISLEKAFKNFRLILNDFIRIFNKYLDDRIRKDNLLFTEKFYKKLNEFNPKEYAKLADKFDYHVDLVQDLMLELTRAANHICDEIRRNISASFRIKEGVLLVSSGPHTDFSFKTTRAEYLSYDDEDFVYHGLKHFMKVREERDHHYGKGISNDYFQ